MDPSPQQPSPSGRDVVHSSQGGAMAEASRVGPHGPAAQRTPSARAATYRATFDPSVLSVMERPGAFGPAPVMPGAAAVVAAAPISGLRGSTLFETCVETYRRHSGEQIGLCACCQQPSPCPSRLHAAGLVEAAGDDPHRYDASTQPHFGPPGEATIETRCSRTRKNPC